MKTTLTTLVLKNFIIGFIVHFTCFILLLYIIWSIFDDQLGSAILLYILTSSFAWIIPFSFFFFLLFPMIFLKVRLPIDLLVFISTLIVSFFIFIVFHNMISNLSNEQVHYPTMKNENEISNNISGVVEYSIPIVHSLTTYIAYLVRRKSWIDMLL